MSIENKQDAAEPSPASTGSVACEPMAWALMQPDSYSVFASRRLAEKKQELCGGGVVVPLYRSPTLTDAEREAIHYVVGDVADITGPVEDILRGLLERTK